MRDRQVVFVTSTKQTGDLGGIDFDRRRMRDDWLASTDNDPESTFVRATGPYGTDYARVADDWADLTKIAETH